MIYLVYTMNSPDIIALQNLKRVSLRQAFTLLELMVVVAIIAVASTLAIAALNNARQKSRDASRVAAIKQLINGLELYNSNQNSYPVVTAAAPGIYLNTAFASANSNYTAYLCLSSGGSGTGITGFGTSCSGTTYMGQVPVNPTPNGVQYTYQSTDATNVTACTTSPCAGYLMTFTLEGTAGTLNAGAHTATPTGLQ